jgi:hypothetical protein
MEGEGFGAEGRQAEAVGGRPHAAHWDAPGQYVLLCTFLDWQKKRFSLYILCSMLCSNVLS